MGTVIRMPPRAIRKEPSLVEMMNYDREHPFVLTLRAQIIMAGVCLIVIGLGIWGVILVSPR